jgi:omega-amidase
MRIDLLARCHREIKVNESLRIAIAQPPMFWKTDENTVQIIQYLEIASKHGAQVCVFPELAVTGFHRQIKTEAKPEIVESALARIREYCAALHVAAVVGTPSFDASGNIFNSVEFIDASGKACATIEKFGITPAEATFFAKGKERPIVNFLDKRCTAILCREANDIDLLKTQLAANSVDIIFWPGIMRPDPEKTDQPEHHIRDAAQLALHTGAYVIQSNWPMSLNYPEESRDSGHSVVISPRGEIMFRLPKAQAGIGVFDLGALEFQWFSS